MWCVGRSLFCIAVALLSSLLCVASASIAVQIDTRLSVATPFPHVWEECVGSGHAALGMRADWQSALTQVHQELGFKRVRFHGLFDDDMNVVLQTGTSFYNIFKLYDFIFSIGMSPLVELSFTPSMMKTSNDTIFHYNANIGLPQMDAWYSLINEFAVELEKRYGTQVVESLFFECWNEYNCGFLAASDPRTAYYELFNTTSKALKKNNANLKIGGPVTCQADGIPAFLSWAKANNVAVDFVSTHLYPTDPAVVSGNMPVIFKQALAQVASSPFPSLPVFLTEYNDGLFGTPPLHDYPFAASYVVKLFANTNGILPLMSWWTFSDVFEEQGFPAQEFDKPTATGWGLLSASGIPKPVYRAFELLHSAASSRLPVKLSNVTSADSTFGALALSEDVNFMHVFVYNNGWPTQKKRSVSAIQAESFALSFGDRLMRTCLIARIDDNHANAPQLWRNEGSPKYLTRDDVARYISASQLVWEHVRCNATCPQDVVPPQGLVVYNCKVSN